MVHDEGKSKLEKEHGVAYIEDNQANRSRRIVLQHAILDIIFFYFAVHCISLYCVLLLARSACSASVFLSAVIAYEVADIVGLSQSGYVQNRLFE